MGTAQGSHCERTLYQESRREEWLRRLVLAWILFLSGLHMRTSDVSLIRYHRYNLSVGIINYRYDRGGQNSSDWTSTRVLLWVRIKWEINLTLTTKHVASIAILMRMIFRSLYLERYEWTVGLQRPRSFHAKGCQEHKGYCLGIPKKLLFLHIIHLLLYSIITFNAGRRASWVAQLVRHLYADGHCLRCA